MHMNFFRIPIEFAQTLQIQRAIYSPVKTGPKSLVRGR